MPTLPLPQLLGSLSISGATENTWERVLAQLPQTDDPLAAIAALKPETLAEFTRDSGGRIGMANATKILTSFTSPRIQAILPKLGKFLGETKVADVPSIPLLMDLSGKNVVLTGAGPAPRDSLAAVLKAAGVNVQGSVGKATHYLICEDANSTSSKAQKARKMGTTVLGYNEVFGDAPTA